MRLRGFCKYHAKTDAQADRIKIASDIRNYVSK